MRSKKTLTISVLALMVSLAHVGKPAPIGTAWTYQGRFMDDNRPADGIYDLECKIFDSSDPCADQVGPTLSFENGEVLDGYITVNLDFGIDIFDGNERWLELGIRPGDSNDAYTPLSPRQEVTPTPYALYAKTAGNVVSGSGTTNHIIKFTGPNTLGNSALYENNYYVGVGTSSPRGRLDVDCDSGDIYLDTFSSQIYIGDVDDDGDGTRFIVDDSAGKFTFENGKVGIGTTNPTRRLVVNEGGLDIYAGSSGEEITFSTERFLMTNSNEDIIIEAGQAPSDYVAFSNAGSEVMAIKNGGVGIGTTSPKAKLEVNGENQEAGLRVAWGSNYPDLYGDFKHTGSGGLKINANANGPWADISLQTDRMTRLFIESGGNVGIGTTTPSEKLDVRGNINVSSNQIKNYYGFPRPNYDSGWVSTNHGEKITLNHNIGGNVDNYVVDLQRKDYTPTHGINNFGIGVNYFHETSFGVNWQQLTTDSITVWLHSDDGFGGQIRIRIWVYN